jgi:hypothetical protein
LIHHEKLDGSYLEYDDKLITKEKLLELIAPILEVIKRFEEVKVFSIEFVEEDFYNIYIYGGGNSKEFGAYALKISKILDDLEIPHLLGEEDYGDLDVILLYEDFYDYREFVSGGSN